MFDAKSCFFSLAFFLVIFAATKASDAAAIGEKAGYHEIDGHTYYIDYEHLYHSRILAKAACDNLNMSLIRFETKEKWDAVTIWLSENELYIGGFPRYYTDGIRYASTDKYIWETTGEEITEFEWAWSCPDYESGSIFDLAILFELLAGGYMDYEEPPSSEMYATLLCQ